jgi:glycosyltransferase involved in cell wall biosynthesis
MISQPVDILLATYNGGAHLTQLMESLYTQSFTNFRVLVRDDCSTDGTVEVLSRYPCVLMPSAERVGPSQSFAALLAASDARYIMFCDQDDVWHPTKIETTLQAVRVGERRYGIETPILAHTDLRLIDALGEEISASFWKFSYLTPLKANTLNRFVVQNNVTGCATMINRALAAVASPIPAQAIMHDWWLALVASAFGIVVPISRVTIDYRQHGRNAIGAVPFNAVRHLQKTLSQPSKAVPGRREQISAFYDRYGSALRSRDAEILTAYLRLPIMAYLENRYIVAKYGLHPNGRVRMAASLLKRTH